jgi:hypothetical protein
MRKNRGWDANRALVLGPSLPILHCYAQGDHNRAQTGTIIGQFSSLFLATNATGYAALAVFLYGTIRAASGSGDPP